MKITIYELLGLVKDGKAPKKIKIKNDILTLSKTNIIQYNFEQCGQLSWDYYIENYRLDEKIVEILDKDFKLEEEKKIPETLEDISEIKCVGCKVEINIAGNKTFFDTDTPIVTEHCIFKINQLIKNQKKIIDYLKSKGDE